MSTPKNKPAAKPAAKQDVSAKDAPQNEDGVNTREVAGLTLKSNDKFTVVSNDEVVDPTPTLAGKADRREIQDGKFVQVDYS